jgi:hypothetical protein
MWVVGRPLPLQEVYWNSTPPLPRRGGERRGVIPFKSLNKVTIANRVKRANHVTAYPVPKRSRADLHN